MTIKQRRSESSWKLPARYWSVFSSGLHIPANGKIDFVRWRLITLNIASADSRKKSWWTRFYATKILSVHDDGIAEIP